MKIKHIPLKTLFLTAFAISHSFVFAPGAQGSDLEEGAKLYAAKNYIKALPFLQRAAETNPMSWQTHYYLANANLALGRMATAKYEYVLCKKTCSKPDIIAHCNAGIARADRHSTQVTASSASSGGTTGGGEAGSEKLSDAQIRINTRKAEIMRDAEAEVAKIKREAKEQIAAEKANANEFYQDHEGRVFTDIDDAREAEIMREADQKCRKVLEAAKRKTDAMGR